MDSPHRCFGWSVGGAAHVAMDSRLAAAHYGLLLLLQLRLHAGAECGGAQLFINAPHLHCVTGTSCSLLLRHISTLQMHRAYIATPSRSPLPRDLEQPWAAAEATTNTFISDQHILFWMLQKWGKGKIVWLLITEGRRFLSVHHRCSKWHLNHQYVIFLSLSCC